MTPTAHHKANRLTVVVDMANALIAGHAARMPRYSYRSVVHAALDCALDLTEAQWSDLGRRTGHYLAAGSDPASETISDVLALLESMLPTPAHQTDLFAGLPA